MNSDEWFYVVFANVPAVAYIPIVWKTPEYIWLSYVVYPSSEREFPA